jgi:hypothetical protein
MNVLSDKEIRIAQRRTEERRKISSRGPYPDLRCIPSDRRGDKLSPGEMLTIAVIVILLVVAILMAVRCA